MYDVAAKTAVVTGAAGGIGLGMAQAFAEAGMNVVLSDLDAERVGAAAAALVDAGHRAIAVGTDVTDEAQVHRLAAATLDEFGAVHVVANNAGIGLSGTVDEMSLDDWQFTIDVDLWGVVHGVRTFLPILRDQGEGHISATSSMAGLLAGPMLGAYHVAKHGVVGLMDTVRRELRAVDSQVRASVLCPGPIATDIVARSRRDRPAGDVSLTEAEEKHSTALAAALDAGMAPREVGDLVLDAIVNERFWILTHPEMFLPLLERRLDEIRADHAHRLP